ncbi:S-layer homology domain-containing protein [Dialister micraerophilus]|uniref:SLH domain-containing protein n=1 Tax=Dialister micraerophilus UPII 345-E TaxID=910314 RepID=E4L747_9FIRM|nr:S-layer homology domain-containing protein [Dialister micraerophilus]EFR43298.1 hypothetical protein HMPREF9220_1339 [Dialister micraerophilus UPII 345-E]
MKKIASMLAVIALSAGASAYAANPFVDVKESSWAYQAVSELSKQGVIEGYSDGTFKGNNHLTRFEMAQIVARLLAQENQLNESQKATVTKLANEYSQELSNLGVRVSDVEKKVGNVAWSGDVRFRYAHEEFLTPFSLDDFGFFASEDGEVYKADPMSVRLRLNADAKVNDRTHVKASLLHEYDFIGYEDPVGGEFLPAGTQYTGVNRMHIEYAPTKDTLVDVGSTQLTLGTGAWYDSDFKGIVTSYDNGKFGLKVGNGRMTQVAYPIKQSFAEAKAHFNNVTAGAFYVDGDVTIPQGFLSRKYPITARGFFTDIALSDRLSVSGDWVKVDSPKLLREGLSTFKHAGIDYGNMNLNEVGSYKLGLHYYDAPPLSYIIGSNHPNGTPFVVGLATMGGAKFWMARVQYVPMKNVELQAYLNFDGETYKTKFYPGVDKVLPIKNTWGIDLTYKF